MPIGESTREAAKAPDHPLRIALAREGIALDVEQDAPLDTTRVTTVASFTYGGQRYLVCAEDPVEQADEPHLSARELEIARLISRGHTTRTVAAVLDISPWTVSTHVRRMFAKLGVGSRSALTARLACLGLLDLST